MPSLWQASQRPMYVRTVWVGGFRHAVLSHDDPYFLKSRRPYSSASSSKLATRKLSCRLSESESLENCLRNFNFVINKQEVTRPKSSRELDIERLDLTDVEQESDLDFLVKANPQTLYELETVRSKNDLNMRTLKSNRTTRSEVKENTELSERVLQWLDLAGKVDLLAPDNVERMTQPRHSWPEIQRRSNLTKSRTAVDVRIKETKTATPKAVDSAKAQPSGPIDRYEFYVPVSANTIENYARQSRNHATLQDTPKGNQRDARTKPKELRANILEARQKVASERNAMEKQYADLISKKLIPDLKANKKQVHIFMPEMPKKCGSIVNSNATSRTESLLSQFSNSQKSYNK